MSFVIRYLIYSARILQANKGREKYKKVTIPTYGVNCDRDREIMNFLVNNHKQRDRIQTQKAGK